jgi:hypothetical protein
MKTVQIDLGRGVFKNVDGVVLRNAPIERFNGFLDSTNNTAPRPGLKLNGSGYGSIISGLYYWSEVGYSVVLTGGSLYKYLPDGGGFSSLLGSAISGSGIGSFARYSSAAGVNTLFFAAGSNIYYTDGATVTQVADADAPISVSHIAFLDTYILAVDGTSKFRWANVSDPTNWSALSFAEPYTDPDPTVAMHVIDRQILLFGRKSLEVWENDGTNPFSRVSGGSIQIGIGAPYSVVVNQSQYFWLTNKRKIAVGQGSSAKELPSPYDEDISNLAIINDCRGTLISRAGYDFAVFTFPTENRTFAYCITTDSWSEWGRWNSSIGDYEQLDINCSCYDEPSNKYLIGSSISSTVYSLDANQYHDDNLSGDPVSIRIKFVTPTLTHGTLKSKLSNALRLVCKSTNPTVVPSPTASIRWRDNDSDLWSNYRTFSLQNSSAVKILLRNGIYDTRQYELIISDAVPGIIAEFEEDIEELR